MSTTSKTPQTPPRRLTVTYYVEPQNLRTITIPVHRANVLIFGLSGAVLWTLASGVFLSAKLVSGDQAGVPAVAALNEAIKTEPPPQAQIVQKTLPIPSVRPEHKSMPTGDVAAPKQNSSSQGAPPVPAKPAESSSNAAASSAALAVKRKAEATPVPTAKPDVASSTLNVIPAAAFGPPSVLANPSPKSAISATSATTTAGETQGLAARLVVRDPTFDFQDKDGVLNLGFKIQNRGKPEAKGKVWGVATFITKSGKRLEVASADGVTFRAKTLTNKELQFPLPDGETGFTAEITIHVADDAANEEMSSTYKLDEAGQAVR